MHIPEECALDVNCPENLKKFHTALQGSLLFSKLEFSIKPDLRGLSFS